MSKNKKANVVLDTLNNVISLQEGITNMGRISLKSILKEELEDLAKDIDDSEEDNTNIDTTVTPTDTPVDNASSDNTSDDSIENADDVDLDDTTTPDDEEMVDLTDLSDEELTQTIDLASPIDSIQIIKNEDGGVTINLSPNAKDDSIVGDNETGTDLPSALGDETSNLDLGDTSGVEPEGDATSDLDTTTDVTTTDEPNEEDKDEKIYEFNFGKVDEKEHDKVMSENKELRKKLTRALFENKKLDETNKVLLKQTLIFENELKDAHNEIKQINESVQKAVLQQEQLVYVTKLLSEHTTTKDEKREIIDKIDSCKSLNEAKEVYNNLNSKLSKSSTNRVNAIVENVMDKPSGSAHSKTVISESENKRNKENMRMLELMKIDKSKIIK
jgi:hypothetical protein